MTSNLDSLRTQAHLHRYIARRDLPKRFATVLILIFFVWKAGYPALALANLLWLVVLEIHLLQMLRTTPPVTRIGTRRLVVLLGTSTLIAIGYFAPGVVLALQPDFGLAMGGMAWILGAVSTNVVMYNALPAFYWSTAVAGFPAALAAVLLQNGQAVETADPYTWMLPVGIVILYLVNTMQQLWEYRDTHSELQRIRAELLASLRKLEHMSLHDGLTGLQNRPAFSGKLLKMLSRASSQNRLAVLMIDLNGFKPINDSYGHDAGDAVLVAVAERLSATLRPGAEVFRLGGDEFAVLSYTDDPQKAVALGNRLITEIEKPVPFEDKALLLGASIGMTVATGPGKDGDTLCHEADQAMYLAKTSKSKSALLFDALTAAKPMSAQCRSQLKSAIRHDHIRPYYQPKFTVDGKTLVGLEALARWHHPEGTMLRPDAFLSDIDEIGLLPDLTQSILRQVLQDMEQWQSLGLDIPRVSLNMPPIVLATKSGREELDWLMAQHPALVERLAFEITEDIYVLRSADPIAVSLAFFRARGVEIFLDDFGTGHASYQHLRLLTPDQLKLDGSLVAGIGQPGPAEAAITGFLAIAHALDVEVVAEQVETEVQRERLAQLGCDYIEGMLLSDVISADDVPNLLHGAPVTAPSSRRQR